MNTNNGGNNNNLDMAKLMSMLSKMDKKQLEDGLSKVNSFLSSNDKNKIIDQLKNNDNK